MARLLRTSGIAAAGVLAVALVVAVPTPSHATPVSTCGETLTGPGTYELTADLFCFGAGAAITMTGADVHLDLGGHTLWGDLTEAGQGVSAQSATGFSITNGSVNGFYRAVWILESAEGRVAGVRVEGEGEASSLAGIALRETTDTVVEDNVVRGTRTAFDIRDFVDRNTLRRNTAVGNTLGLELGENAFDNTVEDNVFRDSINDNVQIGDNSERNRIAGNRITGSGSEGLDVRNIHAVDNLIVGNQIRGNDGHGINLPKSEAGNVFRANVVLGNGGLTDGFDIFDEWLPAECRHTWEDNVFETDNEGDGPSAGCIRGRILAPFAVATAALPTAQVGVPYSVGLSATGGLTPYTWSVTDGALPGGLALSPSGTISGTPTGPGSATFIVTAIDDYLPSHLASRSLTLTIGPVVASPPPPAPTVRCGGRPATIVGTAGADNLVGTAGVDVIVAGAGDDKVAGRGANDVLCGGAGVDRLRGGTGADRLDGGDGRDRVVGGSGDDLLQGRTGRDVLAGGADDDDVRGGRGHDDCRGGSGTDDASGCEVLAGIP